MLEWSLTCSQTSLPKLPDPLRRPREEAFAVPLVLMMLVEALRMRRRTQCFCLFAGKLLQCNAKLLIENILTNDESFCNLCFAYMIKQHWPKAW